VIARRLRDCATWFEREGDHQPAQPGARHVGEDAVVRANLEWPEHPDLHPADFAMDDRQAWKLVTAALLVFLRREPGSVANLLRGTPRLNVPNRRTVFGVSGKN